MADYPAWRRRSASRLRDRSLPALTALGALLVALGLGALTWWCWHRGVSVTRQDGIELSRLDGSWIVLSIAVATLAGIALLVAGRQALLATRPAPTEH